MHIFLKDSFINEYLTKAQLISLLTSKKISQEIYGIKYIICKIQQGNDYEDLFDYIIKLFDSPNLTLKMLINRFFRFYFTNEKNNYKKILLVNTLLKDFNDMKNITFKYLIELSTKETLKFFLPLLKKEIPYKLCYQLYKFDEEYFHILNIQENLNCTEYLHLCSFTNLKISNEILLKNLYDNKKIIPLLRKYYYEKNKISETIINRLLQKDDVQIFYYTFRLILQMHYNNLKKNAEYTTIKNSLLQKCYDASFIYMKQSNELQYHILLLHQEIGHLVSFSNENYILFKSDPDYIKKEKIKLLFNNLDEISISKIKKYNFLMIVELSLKKECVIFEEKLYTNNYEDVINILISINTNNSLVIHMIKKYLTSLKNKNINVFVLQKYLYLCSLYLDNDEILLQNPKIGFNTILGFYINLYKREILNKDDLILSLKKFSIQHKENIKIIIDLINKDVGSIAFYENSFNIEQLERINIDLYCDKKNNNLENFKSENLNEHVKSKFNNDANSFINTNEENNSFILLEEQFNEYLKFEDLLISKPFLEENKLKIKNDSNIINRQKTFLIDHNFLKGVLKIQNGKIYLIIDIIEKNTILEYEINNKIYKKIISKENKIELCSLNYNVRELKVKIYDDLYNIKIGKFFEPYKISINEWDLKFSKIIKYKLVDHFELNDTYVLDDEKFAFKYFNEPVYGKIFNDKIILKSDEKVLKDF